MGATTGSCALAAFKKAIIVQTASRNANAPTLPNRPLPSPSERRRAASLTERPFDLTSESPPIPNQLTHHPEKPETILYLAYGSNLSAETFQGKRGIRPLSAINVVVPDLVMTFDLPGLPYLEPCFANTAYRSSPSPPLSEKSPLLPSSPSSIPPPLPNPTDYHKTRWHKGLVGVVYEVTPTDYAHIIATEGGGASYQDILIPCHPLPSNTRTVPSKPSTPPFKAHTLYSPISPPGSAPPPGGGRFSRPDPNYAQPSARYLHLITSGAMEHALPEEYQNYLHELRAYTITTRRQRMGAWFFTTIFLPVIGWVFGLNRRFADEKGRAPAWLVWLDGVVFSGMWRLYDLVLRRFCGDGERTVGDDDDDNGDTEWSTLGRRRAGSALAQQLEINEKQTVGEHYV